MQWFSNLVKNLSLHCSAESPVLLLHLMCPALFCCTPLSYLLSGWQCPEQFLCSSFCHSWVIRHSVLGSTTFFSASRVSPSLTFSLQSQVSFCHCFFLVFFTGLLCWDVENLKLWSIWRVGSSEAHWAWSRLWHGSIFFTWWKVSFCPSAFWL